MDFFRLSDAPLSQEWISQFNNSEDRNLAKRLLDSIKYVSGQEFEVGIEKSLSALQMKLSERLATYPISAPLPNHVLGHNQFTGAFLINNIEPLNGSQKKVKGKSINYGSEDRMGHTLKRIHDAHRNFNSLSNIEANPTIKTIRKQKIKNIVFVDDICGSGKRFVDFYEKEVPSSLKRLISLGEVKIWLLFYSATNFGINHIIKKIKYFQSNKSNILTCFPITNSSRILTPAVKNLCLEYAKKVYGKQETGLGYKESIGGVVFEHGCPNNLPRILWDNHKKWKAIFKNRAIPAELRPSFGPHSTANLVEVLWSTGHNHLALSLCDSIETKNITIENHLIITILGLINRNSNQKLLANKLLIENTRCEELIKTAIKIELLILDSENNVKITPLGACILKRFRALHHKNSCQSTIDSERENYYPSQCDGHTQYSGSL